MTEQQRQEILTPLGHAELADIESIDPNGPPRWPAHTGPGACQYCQRVDPHTHTARGHALGIPAESARYSCTVHQLDSKGQYTTRETKRIETSYTDIAFQLNDVINQALRRVDAKDGEVITVTISKQ